MKPKSVEQGISWFLMSCYLYYTKGSQVLFDQEYDSMCQYLSDNLDKVLASNHPHKNLLNKEVLEVSGFGLEYTRMIQESAKRWKREENV